LHELREDSRVVVRARNLCQQLRGTSNGSQRILDLVRERCAHFRDSFEALGTRVQPLDVSFAQPERGELGRHCLTARVCFAQPGAYVSAAKRDCPENAELDNNWQIERPRLIEDRNSEVKNIAEEGNE
jgi:hypothetical protein